MTKELREQIQVFEDRQVRTSWDKEREKWLFSVVDIVAILTEQETVQSASRYWRVLKTRLKQEGSQVATNCSTLKMKAIDGKYYLTDVADIEQILRLIQSIPSKKAEPIKQWLAQVGRERIEESINPELSIEKAIADYRRQGYSEDWINQRIKSIEVRKLLTDEWKKSGVKEGKEYAFLTDIMIRTWAGKSVKEYKEHKGLKTQNLRDNMTNLELILNMLAEATATEISIEQEPHGLSESEVVARKGANVAKVAREEIERNTGKEVISKLNATDLKQKNIHKRLKNG
jgi:hypothetical protein